MKNFTWQTWPTIWAFGWWRVKSFSGKTAEFRLFLGPFVLMWWK